MTRSPSHRSAPTCAASDRRATKAGQPYTDNVRPIPIEDIRRIFNGPVTAADFRDTRHVTIKPAVNWRRIGNALIIAVAVGNIVFWTGQLARLVLQ